ncbi:MAG: hypothetical protein AAFZ65_10750 [Planctomycetota bacterium]
MADLDAAERALAEVLGPGLGRIVLHAGRDAQVGLSARAAGGTSHDRSFIPKLTADLIDAARANGMTVLEPLAEPPAVGR